MDFVWPKAVRGTGAGYEPGLRVVSRADRVASMVRATLAAGAHRATAQVDARRHRLLLPQTRIMVTSPNPGVKSDQRACAPRLLATSHPIWPAMPTLLNGPTPATSAQPTQHATSELHSEGVSYIAAVPCLRSTPALSDQAADTAQSAFCTMGGVLP